MIDKISKPQCFKAFYAPQKTQNAVYIKEDASTSVKLISGAAALVGGMGAAYFIARKQGLKGFSGIWNVKYDEFKLMKVGTSALAGGFIAGSLSDDKKYFPAKAKEATHQLLANIVAPLLLINVVNNLYSKVKPNIKIPQFKNNTGIKKVLNTAVKIAPNLAVTVAGLTGGLYLGTKITNMILGRDGKSDARKVKPLDYIYHPDDIATALVLADNNGIVEKTVGKIIPPVFALHGYEAGTAR